MLKRLLSEQPILAICSATSSRPNKTRLRDIGATTRKIRALIATIVFLDRAKQDLSRDTKNDALQRPHRIGGVDEIPRQMDKISEREIER